MKCTIFYIFIITDIKWVRIIGRNNSDYRLDDDNDDTKYHSEHKAIQRSTVAMIYKDSTLLSIYSAETP